MSKFEFNERMNSCFQQNEKSVMRYKEVATIVCSFFYSKLENEIKTQ